MEPAKPSPVPHVWRNMELNEELHLFRVGLPFSGIGRMSKDSMQQTLRQSALHTANRWVQLLYGETAKHLLLAGEGEVCAIGCRSFTRFPDDETIAIDKLIVVGFFSGVGSKAVGEITAAIWAKVSPQDFKEFGSRIEFGI